MRSVLDRSRNSSQNDNLGKIEEREQEAYTEDYWIAEAVFRRGELARRRKRALACVVSLRRARMKKEDEDAGKGIRWLRL
jgi:hypothetical protein